MKRLTLMRHADARWQDLKTDDFARPLNRRGLAGAEAMARRLLELVYPNYLAPIPSMLVAQLHKEETCAPSPA